MSNFISSLGFAFNGIRQCFSKEPHFKVHTFCTVLVIGAGYILKLTENEWVVIIVSVAAVFATELINTAIEILCNMVNREFQKLFNL